MKLDNKSKWLSWIQAAYETRRMLKYRLALEEAAECELPERPIGDLSWEDIQDEFTSGTGDIWSLFHREKSKNGLN